MASAPAWNSCAWKSQHMSYKKPDKGYKLDGMPAVDWAELPASASDERNNAGKRRPAEQQPFFKSATSTAVVDADGDVEIEVRPNACAC